jgi:hypothetical protein
MEQLQALIYQAIGQASMCWSERPKGVFDCAEADKIAQELFVAIQEQTRETVLQVSYN